jgi:subtilisin family serine protease
MTRAFCVLLTSAVVLMLVATAVGAEGTTPVLLGFDGRPDAAVVTAAGGEVAHVYRLVPAIAATVPEAALEQLRQAPGVRYVEPDSRAAAVQELLPWGVARMDSELLHATGNLGQGARVAIIDTGIDYEHRDLKDNYRGGYDFANNDAEPTDDHGHGSHCAGIVAAALNGYGIVGVAPKAELYAIKVLSKDGNGYYSDIIAGIEWAVENRVHVASMSFGSHEDSTTLREACDAAYARGLLLVAASGNDGEAVMVPARYDSVIAVGAVNEMNTVPPWSNWGREIELCAAGTNIVAPYGKGNRYASLWGTSMACPHVSGVAALVVASLPGDADLNGDGRWQVGELRRRLQDTAQDLGPAGKDDRYGYGVVDAFAAGLTTSRFVKLEKMSAPVEIPVGAPLQVSLALESRLAEPQTVKITLLDTTYGETILEDVAVLQPGQKAVLAYPLPTDAVAPGMHILSAVVTSDRDPAQLPVGCKAVRVTVR